MIDSNAFQPQTMPALTNPGFQSPGQLPDLQARYNSLAPQMRGWLGVMGLLHGNSPFEAFQNAYNRRQARLQPGFAGGMFGASFGQPSPNAFSFGQPGAHPFGFGQPNAHPFSFGG
jgi:hypothetical protein